MKKLCLLVALLLAVPTVGQEAKTAKLHELEQIYVAPMSGGLHTYIIKELLKRKKLKVVFTAEDADAVLMGASEYREYGTFSTGQASTDGYNVYGSGTTTKITKSRGDVILLDRQTQELIWETSKTDRFSFKKGNAKLADRIVDQLQKDIKKSKKEAEELEGGE